MRPPAVAVVAGILLLVAPVLGGPSSSTQLWPMPHTVTCTDGSRPVSSSFKATTSSSSAVLAAAITRYNNIFKASALHAPDAGMAATALTGVTVTPKSDADTLGPHTDYSYELTFTADAADATLTANTVYGAMAGLETLSQLFNPDAPGTLVSTACAITDAPQYPHRGLLMDSGRRFLPVPLIEDALDSMSYSKLNVLHLHLSDWAAVRLEVPTFPELTAGLDGQFYTAADAAHLVQYAKERGIRIVPEIDVPAHSAGLAPLEARGLLYCDAAKTLLYNDPSTNKTLSILTTVFKAVATAFPDAVFHLGGDEATPTGTCTLETIHAFEQQLQHVITALGLQPAVWNEVFSDPPGTEPNGAVMGTIIQNWKDSASGATTKAGFQSLVSTYSELYLDQECCAAGNASAQPGDRLHQCYYFDIAAGVSSSDLHLVLGGETAMWTDMYCAPPHCPQQGPWSIWYTSDKDKEFTESFLSLIWPRASAAAGSFWNFDASVDTSSEAYAAVIAAHNARLTARGSTTCPNGCACDWNAKCGTPYGKTPTIPMAVTLINNATKNINVKKATVCTRGAGDSIVSLKPGERAVIHEDFIAVTNKAVGDPYSLWFGGPGWRAAQFTYNLDIQGTYIAYNSPPLS